MLRQRRAEVVAQALDRLRLDPERPRERFEVGRFQVDSERRVKWLRSALTVLSDRELKIVRARRLADESATLESLGDRLGISKERVRQIESRAIEKLRRALLERYPDVASALA